jgi:hypothetical protein
MAARREIDADQAVQDVLDAWGALRTSPASRPLSTDLLFEKMQAYRTAKGVADNHREHNVLTEREAADERATKKVFFVAYREFYGVRD